MVSTIFSSLLFCLVSFVALSAITPALNFTRLMDYVQYKILRRIVAIEMCGRQFKGKYWLPYVSSRRNIGRYVSHGNGNGNKLISYGA